MSHKRVGHYQSGYGFIRAYWYDPERTQYPSVYIGGIGMGVGDEDREEFHQRMCAEIEKRTGRATHESWGGYWQKEDQ